MRIMDLDGEITVRYNLYYRYRHDHSHPWIWKFYANATDLVQVDRHVTDWTSKFPEASLECETILEFGDGFYGTYPDDNLYDGKLVDTPTRLHN